MLVPAVDFPLFFQLPTELQDEIWRYCLPRWVWRNDPAGRQHCILSIGQLGWSVAIQALPHNLHEWSLSADLARMSRVTVRGFRNWQHMPRYPDDRPLEAQWMSWVDVKMAWRDHARDSAHLNWTSEYEVEYVNSGSPIHCVAWEASRLPGGGSVMIYYFDSLWVNPKSPSLADPTGPPIITPLSPNEVKVLEALKQLSNWLVVMQVIVVHSDFKTAAGTDLFGMLGDAPVQIVDVSEEARIEAFFDLAEICERKSPVAISQPGISSRACAQDGANVESCYFEAIWL